MHRFIKATFVVLASMLTASNGVTIDCQYIIGFWGPGAHNLYSCQGTVTDDGGDVITSVTGTLDAGKSLSDVQFFNLVTLDHVVHIYKLPSNFGTIFPGLLGFSWSNSQLRTITAADLQPFPNLTRLEINYNFIRHLDGDLFKYNPKLIDIEMYGNYIESVGKGIFSGLTALQYIEYFSNICIPNIPTPFMGPTYTVTDLQADFEHLCGPLTVPDNSGACSEKCTLRFDALETEVSAIEVRLTAPWYEKLKWFFRTAFGL